MSVLSEQSLAVDLTLSYRFEGDLELIHQLKELSEVIDALTTDFAKKHNIKKAPKQEWDHVLEQRTTYVITR